ncbi:MAG: tetratricopeptide repeat protein, partial [Myxococcota bacterium]
MNRVEVAINEGRCVLVFGSRALQDPETLGELRRRAGIPAAVLGGDAPSPASRLDADVLAPATAKDGGVVCLIEAEGTDSQGLSALASLVAGAQHKPRLVVAARQFNPFLLPTPLRLLKFDHEKKKAREFLFTLPLPAMQAPAAAPAAAAEEPKKKGGAPKAVFVGREEELAALKGMLEVGGPVVISGPLGIGKRWLVEQALAGSALTRHPDFHVGWGSEADSLYARIAMATEKAGDGRLAAALRDPTKRPPPAELAQLAADAYAQMKDAVLVVDRLEHALRRDGTFHREGRFELLLRALLLGGARVVFLSTIRPRFYREGEGASLQSLELGGLKGRELHEIFDAYRVEDFPRDRFGEIHDRIHGHPFAARMFAISVRDAEERDDLLDNKRFMHMDGAGDVEPVKRRIQKAIEALSDEEKGALAMLAHFRMPYSAADADVVEVSRNVRLALQARGLLDQRPDTGGERTWQVHPLVQEVLVRVVGHRETSDFRLLEALGNAYNERASKMEGLTKLAFAQEGNRLLFEAHRIRNRYRIPYPDDDGALESIRGMVRSKKPRYDLAEQRIAETLKQDPANTEVLLLKAELKAVTKAPPEAVQEVFDTVERVAPTPEVFHTEATWHLLKSTGRGRAAAALERGIASFPTSGRLRRRLAGVYVDQNRLEDAERVLKEAMELEPMMPDSYGLLGQVYMMQGPSRFDDAEAALGEARRLDPENALHMARLGALIVERGSEDAERLKVAEEMLSQAITHDSKNYTAHLYMGRLLIQQDGDLERALWLLKKAQKLEERAAAPLVELARIAVKKKEWAEAHQLLDKAIRMEPACHEAFYVRGELTMSESGHVFYALNEFQRALERSPKDSTARARYEKAVQQVKALIESGAYVELQKQMEAQQALEPVTGPAVRREPGKTTQRRRRR